MPLNANDEVLPPADPVGSECAAIAVSVPTDTSMLLHASILPPSPYDSDPLVPEAELRALVLEDLLEDRQLRAKLGRHSRQLAASGLSLSEMLERFDASATVIKGDTNWIAVASASGTRRGSRRGSRSGFP